MRSEIGELGLFLREAGERFSETPVTVAGIDGEGTRRVRELVEVAEVFSARLRAAGVLPGDTVVVQLSNSFECLEAYVGTLFAGAVLVPVPASYGPSETLGIAALAGTGVLLVDERRSQGRALVSRQLANRAPGDPHLVRVGSQANDGLGTRWEAFLAGKSDLRVERAGVSSSALSQREFSELAEIMLFTSGSTGVPKGVVHSGSTIMSAALGKTVTSCSAAGGIRQLQAFPAGHMGGLLGLLRPFLTGEPMALLPRWDAVLAIDTIDRFALNATVGPPVFIISIIEALEATERSRLDLADVEVGSAAVAPDLVERADRLGMTCYRSYGCTEHPCIASGASGEPLQARAYTDGSPIGGNALEIWASEGPVPGVGEAGEVVSSGPSQALGYLDPGEEVGVFVRGRLHTGDLGRLRPDGRLEVVDRIKDVIIRGGETLAPAEIEGQLRQLATVRDAAVVGIPDETLGETVCAVVVPRPGQEVTLRDVQVWLEKRGISLHKIPESFFVAQSIPKNATGKILRRVLREQVLAAGGVKNS